MSNYKWLLDAGHGGILNGKYTTAPAKMFKFPDGAEVYEGLINRQITSKVVAMIMLDGIDFGLVYDEHIDTPLAERVSIANRIYAKNKKCIYLSIHSNAGHGNGVEVYTSPGQTSSDIVAEIFCKEYKTLPFPFRPGLGDGDLDKEEKFYVLVNTKCPALLVENLFFDERTQADFLISEVGQMAIANVIYSAIKKCEKTKPI
jgi:N-acetylmuramoyl-L-alanine amidase